MGYKSSKLHKSLNTDKNDYQQSNTMALFQACLLMYVCVTIGKTSTINKETPTDFKLNQIFSHRNQY